MPAVRVEVMYKALGSLLLAIVAVLFGPPARAQQVAAETPQTILAAQIRTQGFTCDKALGATRDRKRSQPDRAVWASNAATRHTASRGRPTWRQRSNRCRERPPSPRPERERM